MSAVATGSAMLVVLLAGAWVVAAADRLAQLQAVGASAAAIPRALTDPLRRSAALLLQQQVRTERPDALNWKLAPALYLLLAGAGLSVVPLWEGGALIQVETGLVLWGAVEALTVVVVFLHGWSSNSILGLIGGYRYVAIGLPAMLFSMFVLIATALPAESLAIPAVIEAQREIWNVVRQPLGLPLFLILGLSLSLRGPMDYADSRDLAGGTRAEVSGASRLLWEAARRAMLVAFSAMAAAAFLGGHLGPLLPGPVWMLGKTLAVLALTLFLGRRLARVPPSRMLTLLWVILLPLSFVDLAIAGVAAL